MSEHHEYEFGKIMVGIIATVLLIAVVYFVTAARFQGPPSVGTPEQIAQRTKPIGRVVLASSASTVSVPTPAAEPKPAAAATQGIGATIYAQACFACHATGAANAPKIDDRAAWAPRIAQGIDRLLQTAIHGKGAMPPRGTCASCSDEDLRAAIHYMLDQLPSEG